MDPLLGPARVTWYNRVSLQFVDADLERRYQAYSERSGFRTVSLSLFAIGLGAFLTDLRCSPDVDNGCGVLMIQAFVMIAVSAVRQLDVATDQANRWLLLLVRLGACATALSIALLLPAKSYALLVMMATVPISFSVLVLTDPKFRFALPMVLLFAVAFAASVLQFGEVITVIHSFDLAHAAVAVCVYLAWLAALTLLMLYKTEVAKRSAFALQETLRGENLSLKIAAEPFGMSAISAWLSGGNNLLAEGDEAGFDLLDDRGAPKPSFDHDDAAWGARARSTGGSGLGKLITGQYETGPLPAPPSGVSTLQRWTLDASKLVLGRRLASGSSGQVFQGRYGDTRVAVKELFSVVMARDMTTFARECAALTAVSHPNVLQFIGVARSDDDRILVVTELCDASLDQLLEGQVQPLAAPLVHARELAAAVDFCHGQGLVHGDIKPANVLLKGPSGTVKLCDFGLARVGAGSSAEGDDPNFGSPTYMAPELLLPAPHLQRPHRGSDVYALGMVLWCLSTSSALPYPDHIAGRISTAVIEGLRPALPPDAPPKIRALITQCLDADAALRPTAEEVVAALHEMSDEDFNCSSSRVY